MRGCIPPVPVVVDGSCQLPVASCHQWNLESFIGSCRVDASLSCVLHALQSSSLGFLGLKSLGLWSLVRTCRFQLGELGTYPIGNRKCLIQSSRLCHQCCTTEYGVVGQWACIPSLPCLQLHHIIGLPSSSTSFAHTQKLLNPPSRLSALGYFLANCLIY